MKTFSLLIVLVMSAIAPSCSKKQGCMDIQAINYNSAAEKDCNCCTFEKVVFYSRYPTYNVGGVLYSILTNPVKVYVNNQEIGTITAFYPNGPGTSTVPGVVVYEPGSNKKVEWYAKVTAPNGSFLILGSGTIAANNKPVGIQIF